MGDGLSRRHLFGAGAAIGAGALVGGGAPAFADSDVTPTDPFAAIQPAALAPTLVSPALPGVEYRFRAGITLEPYLNNAPAATVTKSLSPTGDAFTTSTIGTSYLGMYLEVPNGGRLVAIEFHLRLANAATMLVALVHLRPTELAQPVISQAVAGAGLESFSAVLDRNVDNAVDSYFAFVQSNSADRQLIGIRYGFVPPGLAVVPVTPGRVYDSRLADGKLHDGEERTISLANAVNNGGEVVPAGAQGVAITLTVTETEGSGGYVSAFPADSPWPGTSSVNWFGPGQNLATAVVVATADDRHLTLRGGVQPTHVVVDVTGYLL